MNKGQSFLLGAVLCYSASIADKEKTVLCHFLFRSSAQESGGTNFHRSADMDFMSL